MGLIKMIFFFQFWKEPDLEMEESDLDQEKGCAGASCMTQEKPVRHIVDALKRMDSPLKEYVSLFDTPEGLAPGVLFEIQSDPVGQVGVDGCQPPEIIEYAKCLVESLNARFPCRENALTITKLEEAMAWQEKRTKNRVKAGVEGFNQPIQEG